MEAFLNSYHLWKTQIWDSESQVCFSKMISRLWHQSSLNKLLNFSASISFPYKMRTITVPISKVVGRIEWVNTCKALRTILDKWVLHKFINFYVRSLLVKGIRMRNYKGEREGGERKEGEWKEEEEEKGGRRGGGRLRSRQTGGQAGGGKPSTFQGYRGDWVPQLQTLCQ